MVKILLKRAGVADLIGLLQARAELTLPARRYGHLLAQVALSESYAVFDAADRQLPLTVAGIAPLGNRAGEIWFGVRAGGLGAFLLPIIRCARQVLRSRAPDYPGGLMCLVRDGHRPGERLACGIGCVPLPVMLGDYREWSWVGGVHCQSLQGAGYERADGGSGS